MPRILPALLAVLSLTPAPAVAPVIAHDDIELDAAGPLGIAVAQAPEAGTGICFGDDAEAALACARAECVDESGLSAAHCLRVLWCYPARWSADVFMQHTEGLHWHDYLCGWEDREQLEAAVALKCASEWLIACEAVAIWNPFGDEQPMTDAAR